MAKELNFKYGLYTNFWALKEYHLKNGLNDNYLNINFCILVTFIVEEYYKNVNMPRIEMSGRKYVLLNSNYILNNLIYIKIKSRQLGNYLKTLKDNGVIDVYTELNNSRYIHVNSELIELWYNHHYSITATSYLSKNHPERWKMFVNEWEPHFKSKNIDFKRFIDDFNDTRVIEEDNMLNGNQIFEHLVNAVRYKLYKVKSAYYN